MKKYLSDHNLAIQLPSGKTGLAATAAEEYNPGKDQIKAA